MNDGLIVGAGPAGLAAAIQLRRYMLTYNLFEGTRPGGLLWNANWVENYLGFSGGIAGSDLARAFLDQVGEESIIREPVIELNFENGIFYARTPAGIYPGRAAVIASGTKPRLLTGFTIPDELQPRIIYQLTDVCDLEGKKIVIVGCGDAAFDYAINLARKNSVIILNRSERVKCLPLLLRQAQACPEIKYYPGMDIMRLCPLPQGSMIVECSSPYGQAEFQADYLIGAIGREPRLDFISAALQSRRTELETMGILHFVGDVKNGIFRQTAIAVGDGIRAGMQIYKVLKENANESNSLSR